MSSQSYSPGEKIKTKPPVLNRQKISIEKNDQIIKRKLDEKKLSKTMPKEEQKDS